ncbi:hypothetical protein Ssi03_31940 [Sphaerisporangium siamense]|uniref:Uncharacterized protein n=1 Tax=Sphaerisporangium siamense TaxID=795645 RepID=A0A7W7D4N9_9ACTN|nr:hypothetical protein [Sphaerisporangium siamense]MBB4698736.1 hypothetical protein [Sphaerisporangium siamense]GII85204.1 hypothetical protein Ssi03_31940 [Sphaerisporangium siamense]
METIDVREADRGNRPEAPGEGAGLLRLRDQLRLLGLSADLCPAGSALLVQRPDVGLPLWVFVGYGGAYYSWQSAEKRHPVRDAPGAARALAEYIGGRVFRAPACPRGTVSPGDG